MVGAGACGRCGLERSFLSTRKPPRWQCVPCERKRQREYREANREKIREYGREYVKRNPEKSAAASLRFYYKHRDRIKEPTRTRKRERNYGLTEEGHAALLSRSAGVCEICKGTTKCMAIDHNHQTGMVRGYLCGKCNSGLGLFNDSVELMLTAVEYLRNGGPKC